MDKSLFKILILAVTGFVSSPGFSQEIGITLGLTKFTNVPPYNTSQSTDGQKPDISEISEYTPQYSIFIRKRIYRRAGAMLSIAYSELARKIGITNIFLTQDELSIVPIEAFLYWEFLRPPFHISPKVGMGYAYGNFNFSSNNYVAKWKNAWKYRGGAMGFPVGVSFAYHGWKNMDFGLDFLFRYYEIEDFETDYKCENGGSNKLVVLTDEWPGPSCLDADGNANRKATIDYSNFNLSLVFGFGLN